MQPRGGNTKSSCWPEVALSRTHFQVLGLEASSPRKLPCPRLEDSTIFECLKFCRSAEKCFSGSFFWRSTEKNFLRPFFRIILAFVSLASSIPVLGLGFFCVLGLEPCVLDSTSDVGNCKLYQDIRVKYFGITKTSVHTVVTKYNINKLATYSKKAGRLSEFD